MNRPMPLHAGSTEGSVLHDACRDTDGDGVGGNVAAHDSIHTNHGVVADGDTLEDRDFRPQPYVLADLDVRDMGALRSGWRSGISECMIVVSYGHHFCD